MNAGSVKSPLHFGWLNATCHKEIFNYFDVPKMVPTMVSYAAVNNKHTKMIEKFGYKKVSEQSDMLMNS